MRAVRDYANADTYSYNHGNPYCDSNSYAECNANTQANPCTTNNPDPEESTNPSTAPVAANSSKKSGVKFAAANSSCWRTAALCMFILPCFFVSGDAMKREPPPRLQPRQR